MAAPCLWVLGHWQRGAGWLESPGCFLHPRAAPEQSPAATEGNLQENRAAEDKNGHFSRLHLPCPAKAPSCKDPPPWHVALPFARSPSPGYSWAVSGCSVHTDGVPGEPQAPQRLSTECHGVGLCLSAAVTRGLQASFRRIIYTNIYISCLAGKVLCCGSCTLGKIN